MADSLSVLLGGYFYYMQPSTLSGIAIIVALRRPLN